MSMHLDIFDILMLPLNKIITSEQTDLLIVHYMLTHIATESFFNQLDSIIENQ